MQHQYSDDDPIPPVDVDGGTWFLGAAVAYSHVGFALVPNRPGTKEVEKRVLREKPEGSKAEWWSYVALRTPADVSQVWQQNPLLQPGLVAGRSSQLLVVDLDVKRNKKPHQSIHRWEEETGIKLPDCPKVMTPTGGEHWYYRLPPGLPYIKSVEGWLSGVDIRAEKGQLILPPSFNRDEEAKQKHKHGYVVDSQYHWMDLSGSPYTPTPAELRTELDDSPIPDGLVEDILEHGSTRTEIERIRRIKAVHPKAKINLEGIVLTESGDIDVDFYEKHGAPDEFQEKALFYLATWWGGKHRISEDEAVERGWAVIKKSKWDESDPWTKEQVEKKVRRQHRWAVADTTTQQAERQQEYEAKEQLISQLRARWAQDRGTKR